MHMTKMKAGSRRVRRGLSGAGLGLLLGLAACGGGGDGPAGTTAETAAAVDTAAAGATGAATAASATDGASSAGSGDRAAADTRESAQQGDVAADGTIPVRIIAINDFHGQLSAGRTVDGRPVGGAAVLKAWIRSASEGYGERVIIASAGDLFGASSPESGLLQDEPTLMFLNSLGNSRCRFNNPYNVRCNVVATVGVGEAFDGPEELRRKLDGGNHAGGPYLQNPWRGVNHAWISSNYRYVYFNPNQLVLQPWTLKEVPYTDAQGRQRWLKLGFMAATLDEARGLLPEGSIGSQTRFDPVTDALNQTALSIQGFGARTVVGLLHSGGSQYPVYEGATQSRGEAIPGLESTLYSLGAEPIEVLITGHTHRFTNRQLLLQGWPRSSPDPIATQAWSAGTAIAMIDLKIDVATGATVSKSAQIVRTWGDAGPGLTPDADAAALVGRAERRTRNLRQQVIASFQGAIPTAPNAAGESAFGNLLADAVASTTGQAGSGFAVLDVEELDGRPDCPAGQTCTANLGDLYRLMQDRRPVTTLSFTGAQIRSLLADQWRGTERRHLGISGLSYTWDASKVSGDTCNDCVVEVRDARSGTPLVADQGYSVVVNHYTAYGVSGWQNTVAQGDSPVAYGRYDIDLLRSWLQAQTQPVVAAPLGERVVRLN